MTSAAGSERWAALEVRLLVAFVAVVDEGSFTAAAKRLGYTQSGISQQIAALEQLVERRLLVRHRGGRRIELTPIGDSFLRHCRMLLTQIDSAFTQVVEHEQALAMTARVASFPSAAVQLLPRLERALHLKTSLRIELLEAVAEERIFECLDTHDAELGLAALPVPSRFLVEELGVDPYVAVVARDSRLARRPSVSPDQLRGQPLLGIRGCSHEHAVEARLAAAGVDCRAFTRYDDNRLIQALAAAGSGVAIVPALTVDPADESIRVLKISLPLPPRVIAFIQLRDTQLSAASRQFKKFAGPICRQLLQEAAMRVGVRTSALSSLKPAS